jgi:Xaa-Pro aminopeptidase
VKRAKFIFASSEASADLLYLTKFRVGDPCAYINTGERSYLLLSDLEIDRGKRVAAVDEVLSLSELEKTVQGENAEKPSMAKILARFISDRGTQKVTVPQDFPFGLARALRKEKIKLKPEKGAFVPERQIKTPAEIKAMSAALRITEAGFARAIEVLKATTIRKDNTLMWHRKVLTSELLRVEIESAILRAGGEARGDSIVAGGEQACDPHERGSGPLKANELIILDIFPRDAKSGYFGDMTRTVLRGKASDAQRHLWETCLQGQKMALEAMKPGVSGLEIHESIKKFFTDSGYPTEIRDGRWQGFFHGTGHGLGLEVHESPRFGAATLEPGLVLTVEPGIYVPGVGGVRHEDVAAVTAKGNLVLSRFPKVLEI